MNDSPKPVIVPFGKYKGKPLEKLMQDESYAKWLTGQDWFQDKFQSMYTLIVHNYHNEPIDTPEHNQMQIKFLDEFYCLKVAYLISKGDLFKFDSANFQKNVPSFLRELNINKKHFNRPHFEKLIERVKAKNNKGLLNLSKVLFEKESVDATYDVSYGYSMGASESDERMFGSFFNQIWDCSYYYELRIELKPSIGDDYPSVLRSMKANRSNILIAREYNGTGVTWDQAKEFLNSQGIKVLEEAEIESFELPEFEQTLSFETKSFEELIA